MINDNIYIYVWDYGGHQLRLKCAQVHHQSPAGTFSRVPATCLRWSPTPPGPRWPPAFIKYKKYIDEPPSNFYVCSDVPHTHTNIQGTITNNLSQTKGISWLMPPMPPCKKRDGASRLKLCCWVIEVLELLGLVAVHCNSQTSKDQPWQLSKPYKYWLIWCVCIIQDRTRSYKYCSLIGLGLVLCFKWACPRNRVPIALLKLVKRRAGRQRNSSAHLWRTIALHACSQGY